MTDSVRSAIVETCRKRLGDRTRLLDVLRDVQQFAGGIASEALDLIAHELGIQRVEVESAASFYAFLNERPNGKVVIRLCDDIIDRMHGADHVQEVFEQELGVKVGQTTPDGKISLKQTACIGMCDQAPAALIDDTVVTRLSTDSVRQIVAGLREHGDARKLVAKLGDGNNACDLVSAMVENNLRVEGPVIFARQPRGEALGKALAISPAEVIRSIKTSRLRGRGGAGFPTGMKWEFTRSAAAERRFLLCNADEGEPGTFKDRVILTERPDLLFEGMTIAGYAIGACQGILYLRAEYGYLRDFLESVLQERRRDGWLGKPVRGSRDFDFDIRIQLGAGAYICGEETALISSCEGLRGDPKNRPPFPAQRGYLGFPTSVNNVETLCCVARIIQEGPAWFAALGSKGSSGTKLLSISGDCKRPGVYELPFGVTLREVLGMAGAAQAAFVQVGGPSGQMVGPGGFDRVICFDDLATGGAIMVFGPGRDPLEVAETFLRFFMEESCGYCTPCRVGNVLMLKCLEKIRSQSGEPGDLDYLQRLAETVKRGSRCGLGQTSPNPVLCTLRDFRENYEALLQEEGIGLRRAFDLEASLARASVAVGRVSRRSETRGEFL